MPDNNLHIHQARLPKNTDNENKDNQYEQKQ